MLRYTVWVVLLDFGEGRLPNVEVRKINSNELEDTLEREPFICDSDTEDELMDEEAPELIGNGTYYKEFTSEVSPNMGEESGEGTVPLRLFVYGVRIHQDIDKFSTKVN